MEPSSGYSDRAANIWTGRCIGLAGSGEFAVVAIPLSPILDSAEVMSDTGLLRLSTPIVDF